MKKNIVLGIDIGGSGIKAAPVNIENGKMLGERHRIPTPSPATPEKVALVIAEMLDHFKWQGLVGCGFPGVIQNGVARTAWNLDKAWLGTNIDEVFTKVTGEPVFVVNDADAAGLAEMKFGAGKDVRGLVLLCTIGTGIGSVVFNNGLLVPNTEFGHIEIKGMDAELYASDAARKANNLSWEKWALRFNEYLAQLEFLLSTDLIILGGGASKKGDKFLQFLDLKTKILTAELQNNAGIVGAALAGQYQYKLARQAKKLDKQKKKTKGK